MSAWRKFAVFGPQVVGTCISCALLSVAIWLGQHEHFIAMVPTIVGVGVSSVVTFATAINKVTTIFDNRDGWQKVGAGCANCVKLERDRNELRQALLAAPPEETGRE